MKAPNLYSTKEQENISLTVRLTSLTLQQYKIGFKVKSKDIKVTVPHKKYGKYKADESVFSISGSAIGARSIYGK